jgi:hypothetical protein
LTVNSRSLRLSPDVVALFASVAQMGRVEGRVASNLDYIQYLEHGTSRMPARPVIDPYLAEYQAMVTEELHAAMDTYPGDPIRAAQAGISMATLRIMRAMADRTAQPAGAYFTGRAKNSWVAYLPDGRSVAAGNIITAEQQRAIIKNRRTAALKRAGRSK